MLVNTNSPYHEQLILCLATLEIWRYWNPSFHGIICLVLSVSSPAFCVEVNRCHLDPSQKLVPVSPFDIFAMELFNDNFISLDKKQGFNHVYQILKLGDEFDWF